jgi:hypothetical protein
MRQQMGLLLLLAGTISTASSQAETRIQGNTTNVKINMNFDKPTKTQSLQATISQLSSLVFQIAVANEHQACQLARIINSDLAPCFHEQRKENEPEQTDAVLFSRNNSAKQHKTTQHALWLPKKHTSQGSISTIHPPHVMQHILLQASQDSPDHHPYMAFETSNTAPKDLPVTPVPKTKPMSDFHSHTAANAAVSSADHPDVLLLQAIDNGELPEHDQILNSSNTSTNTPSDLPTTALPPTNLVPDPPSHTSAAAPIIRAAHPDAMLLQVSHDAADHPLHGTKSPPPPAAAYSASHHTICNHTACRHTSSQQTGSIKFKKLPCSTVKVLQVHLFTTIHYTLHSVNNSVYTV